MDSEWRRFNDLGIVDSIMLQNQLHEYLKNHLDESLKVLEERKHEISVALESESKSSAGDKHETGRAMLQLEREKLGEQIKKTEQNFEVFNQIKRHKGNGTARFGSIILTNNSNYFIATSLPSVTFDSKTFYFISPKSPIGSLLLGKKAGDQVDFNGNTSTITEVL